jgi:hypothetical protein
LGVLYIASIDAAENSTSVGLRLDIAKSFDLDVSIGSNAINMVARQDPATGKYTAAQVEWTNPGPINPGIPDGCSGHIPITFTLGCALVNDIRVKVAGDKYKTDNDVFHLVNVGKNGTGEGSGPEYIEFQIFRLNGVVGDGANVAMSAAHAGYKIGMGGQDLVESFTPGSTLNFAIGFVNVDDLANGGTFEEGERYEETLTFTFVPPPVS